MHVYNSLDHLRSNQKHRYMVYMAFSCSNRRDQSISSYDMTVDSELSHIYHDGFVVSKTSYDWI
jgi:hypothetical protein